MTDDEVAPDRDLLWKQYALHVDLYKFYLDLAVKVYVFYYAITGSILTYYFQSSATGPASSSSMHDLSRFSLLLPIGFSIAIGGLFFYGAKLLRVIRKELFAIRDKLSFATAPEIVVLVAFLRTFGAIMILTGLSLGWLFATTT